MSVAPCVDCGQDTDPVGCKLSICRPCFRARLGLRGEVAAQMKNRYPCLSGRAVNVIMRSMVVYPNQGLKTIDEVVSRIVLMGDHEILSWRMVGKKMLTEIRASIPKQAGIANSACHACGRPF